MTVVKALGGEVMLSFGSTEEIIRFFERAEGRLSDLRIPFDRYGRYLVEKHIPAQFKAQGTPKRWAALSEKYRRWKERRFPGRPILVLSGRMKAGFRWKAKKRSLQIINRVAAGQKGNKTPRFEWHQGGTPRMPARPMLQITDRDLAVLGREVLEYLETGA